MNRILYDQSYSNYYLKKVIVFKESLVNILLKYFYLLFMNNIKLH